LPKKRRQQPPSRLPQTSDDIDFDLLPDLIGCHLRRAELTVFSEYGRKTSGLQTTPGQFGVLTLIGANPGLTQSALATAVGIERSTMVAVINRLEERGLVERRPSKVDRRSYALVLSGPGRKLLDRLKVLVREHERSLFAGFSDDERATLMSYLLRIWRPAGRLPPTP